MLKYEQSELEDLAFVDPRVIQPLYKQPTLDDLVGDQKSNCSLSDQREDSSPSSYIDSNIKMEQCISLDLFFSAVNEDNTMIFADELNTPTFDAAEEPVNVTNNDIYNQTNPFNFQARLKFEDSDRENTINCHENSVVNSDMNNISLLSPTNDITVIDDINLEEYDLLSDCNDAILNDFSDICGSSSQVEVFGQDQVQLKAEGYSPENSNCSVDSHHNYALKLNLDNKFHAEPPVLQTPDVINTICSFDKDFLVYAEEKQPEEILAHLESTSSTNIDDSNPFDWNPVSTPELSPAERSPPPKRTRKRKSYDDDDEDYVPTPRSFKSKRTSYSDSDDSEEEVVVKKVSKRGRPSKRVSVSSENSECSKYREMRDKNNEASRKSRQKRKIQEIQYEEEMSELTTRNIQLKAQVSELEKTVDSFRSNLMTILIKK